MSLRDETLKHTLKNALEHEGKASLNAVIGKLMALHSEDKKFVTKNIKEIAEIVREVNKLSLKEIMEKAGEFEGQFELKKREQREGLPELEWAEKEKVVTRYAPNPNGPFHLGNARQIVLSHEYAKKYDGVFFLRFDDTDPKVKKPIENAEEIFLEDLEWLDCKPDKTFFASDRLDIYYDFMKKLIDKNKIYSCDCKSESWRKLIKQKKGCKCRGKRKDFHLKVFKQMLANELKEGSIVLRLKTDLKAKDPALRDWWVAKIVNKPLHPRVKDKFVWPSYNFQSAIDDHELKVSLIIRGQEHFQNTEKQKFLYKYFDWVYPHAIHTGRIKFSEGLIFSTSEAKKGIDEGKYTGWDDVRLGTIRALRRRGFQAKALRKALLDLGINTNDAGLDLKRIIDYNKQLLLPTIKVLPFLREGMKLQVLQAVQINARVPVYFNNEAKDAYETDLKAGIQDFLVDKKAVKEFKVNDSIRLKQAYNIRIKSLNEFDALTDFIGLQKVGFPTLQWIKFGNEIDVEVLMPDNQKVNGLTSKNIFDLSVGDEVLFERFGIVRIEEKKEGKIVSIFTHE
ncbi:MAG: glutamate--tRNA ligase [archaeon]